MQIHSLSMGLARAYLLESQAGLVLVDAGSPGSEHCVKQLMQAMGRVDLRLIFISHAHLDHYGSAAALRRLTGAPVAIHRADGESMCRAETPLDLARGRGRFVKWLFPLVEAYLRPEPTQPDLLLEDGDNLDGFGLDATVIYTPGHTPGSCCLMVQGRFAFVGDLVSTAGKPHAQRYYASDWSLISASLARLQALKPEKVYPGHGRWPLDGQGLQRLTMAH